MQRLITDWKELPVGLTLPVVCRIFDMTEATAKKNIKEGKLKGTKIGGKWMFDKDYIRSVLLGKPALPIEIVCDWLQISQDTAKKIAEEGILKAELIDGKLMFDEESIVKAVNIPKSIIESQDYTSEMTM